MHTRAKVDFMADSKTVSVRRLGLRFVLAGCVILHGAAQRSDAQDAATETAEPTRWAVIFVGLPGDAEHEQLFRETADQLQTWLTGPSQFPREQVLRLPPEPKPGEQPAAPLTASVMRSTLTELKAKLKPDDTLWVFTLGHGNYDGKRGWFHVAGPDPSGDDFGRWMAEIRCREQVIWLTQASSGWFVKPLSRPGRIVIAATATDDESNETEFPQALATVVQRPVAELDRDQDGAVSVAELFTATVSESLHRFKSDNRLPTEHPQLDDNGDGVGSEAIWPANSGADATSDEPASKQPSPPTQPIPPTAKADGELARRTLVPYLSAVDAAEPKPDSR
jgi:hypothetical protein